MARRTKEDAQETRDQILNAAAYVFSEKGFACTSLEDIAKAAKVTRGAIYWHFKNKVDIFEALHEQLHSSVMEMLLQDIEKAQASPLKQLEDHCINLLLDIEKDIQKKRALTLFLLKCDYSGELQSFRERHRAKKAEHIKVFSCFFEKAKKEGKCLQHEDSQILALSVSCYMKGIIVEYLNNPDLFDIKKRAPELIGLLFQSLTRNIK